MILSTHGIVGSQIQSFVGLLDTYPNAAAAYSVRKLRAAYTGSAIRVRRSSDNAESDIGFSGGNLDTSALTSFCGAGNGFVTTWYDQSGNARNATQTTAANQPQIVSSGSVILENGKPSIQMGANKQLSLSSNLVLNTQTYFAIVSLNNDISASTTGTYLTRGAAEGSQTVNLWGFGLSTGTLTNERYSHIASFSGNVYGLGQVTTDITSGQYVFNFKFESPSTSQLYQNNTLQSTANPSPFGDYTATNYPNSFTSIGVNFDGKYQELIVYPNNKNVNDINTNINNFYSIY